MVAWLRVKSELSRAEIYERMAAPGGLYAEGVAGEDFRDGSNYALRTVTGEKWTGRMEFISARRGICVTVEALNGALCWLAIEGLAREHKAQLWFSTYGWTQAAVTEIETKWASELKRILE